MASTPRRGLGRGLQALMADLAPQGDEAPEGDLREVARSDATPLRRLPIAAIRPNPDQPRRSFPESELKELAASIRSRGVIQPILVRPDPRDPAGFEIVAGERRWRAAQEAGLAEVPAIVREYGDAELLEVAIIENVQRAGLNAIDEGSAYRSLMERFGHTQEEVAEALGKSRSHVANQIRLLQLPVDVQHLVEGGRLTAGQVRPLVGHPEAARLAEKVLARGLSAREVERLAKGPAKASKGRPRAAKDNDTRAVEGELSASLRMAVRIDHVGPGEGRLTISFASLEQLDELLRRLSGG
jgi:ParB family transcriptional regulator, chromosome partitioning protein